MSWRINRLAGGVAALGAALLLLAGCATPVARDDTAYKLSRPKSILVLPPLNQSPDVRATYSVLATVTQPIAEAGYYVFPVALVDQTFKENGLPLPGDMHQAPLAKLREIFGTDAVLYLTVDRYGSSYTVIDSTVVVSVRAKLVDARNGQTLWTGAAAASNNQGSANNMGLVGLLVSAAVRQILNSAGDPGHAVARTASQQLLQPGRQGLLFGPRSPQYLKDGEGR